MINIILIPVLLLLALPSYAQKSTEMDNVINLINQYDKALTKKDSVALGKFLTEDFIGSIPNGQSFDKKSFISYHCSPTSRVRELKKESTSSWNIKFAKEYAIVNRFVTYFANTGGKKQVEVKVKKLEVCVKIKNKWMIASLQGTEVLK